MLGQGHPAEVGISVEAASPGLALAETPYPRARGQLEARWGGEFPHQAAACKLSLVVQGHLGSRGPEGALDFTRGRQGQRSGAGIDTDGQDDGRDKQSDAQASVHDVFLHWIE